MKTADTILLTIPNFKTAGSQYVLLSLYHLYKQSQHRTYVMIDDESAYFPNEVAEADRVVMPKNGYLGLKEGIRYVNAFSKTIKRLQIGVVHSWDYRSEVWEALACRKSGIPYVFTKKNNAWSRKWWLKSMLAKHIAYDHPDMGKRFFDSGALRKKSTLISHGVNTSLFKPNSNRKSLSYKIGCIGNIGKNKNQIVILKAMSECTTQIHCRFYGKADEKYLETMKHFIRENQLGDRISFLGFVENMQLPEIIRELDILVLSSYNEGLPVILLEAMACGVYCLASHSGGGSEYIIKSCNSGELFAPDDANQLAKLIDAFYSDPENKKRNVNLAAEEIKRKFSVEMEAKKYLELFKTL